MVNGYASNRFWLQHRNGQKLSPEAAQLVAERGGDYVVFCTPDKGVRTPHSSLASLHDAIRAQEGTWAGHGVHSLWLWASDPGKRPASRVQRGARPRGRQHPRHPAAGVQHVQLGLSDQLSGKQLSQGPACSVRQP